MLRPLLTSVLLLGSVAAGHAEDPRETTCTDQFDASTSGSIGGLAVFAAATPDAERWSNGDPGLYTPLTPGNSWFVPADRLARIRQQQLPAWVVFEFQHTDAVRTDIPGGPLKGFAVRLAYADTACHATPETFIDYASAPPELRREILRTAVAIRETATGEPENLPEDELARIAHIPPTSVDTEIETYLRNVLIAMQDQ